MWGWQQGWWLSGIVPVWNPGTSQKVLGLKLLVCRWKLCRPSATELELGVPMACSLGLLLCSKKQREKPCARNNLGEKSVWFYPHPFYFSSLWNVQYLSPLWCHPQTGAQLWVLFTHNCLLVMSKWNVQVSLMKSKCNVQSSLMRSVVCKFLWWWVGGMCNWWKLFQYWKSTHVESSYCSYWSGPISLCTLHSKRRTPEYQRAVLYASTGNITNFTHLYSLL
jgi:hypothetical protein